MLNMTDSKVLYGILATAVVLSTLFYFQFFTSSAELTIYAGRSEDLVGPIIEDFEEETGISVEVRYGSTTELASVILEEDEDSPADIFYARDPGGLGAVEHRFAKLPNNLLEVPEQSFRSPEGNWLGISGRARTVVYNTDELDEEDLPDNMWGFTEPEWEGRIGWAPTNGSFQAMITAMRATWGEESTKEWVREIDANDPKEYPRNTPQVDAAARGEIDVGFVNHYYLFRFLAEEGEDFSARNYHPRSGGPGATVLISGAGILEVSEKKEEAEKFLEFMVSEEAQNYFAEETFEYPVRDDVETHPELEPLEELDFPRVDMTDMMDAEGTLDLLREVGVI